VAAEDPVVHGGRSYPYAVRAFAHRDFRLLWSAAVVSSSGSQMQLAALGWVVALLTESATKVGLIAFIGVVPLVVLSPVGGSLADRYPRRKVLVVTQSVQMVQAVALWGTWAAGVRSFWLLFVLAGLGGVTAALNAPVWQAYIPALVPREDLPNAVMLNSTQFNIAKALGPVIAGALLVDTAGASWCFLLNAISFAYVLGTLLVMRTDRPAVDASSSGSHYWRDFVDGVAYVRRSPGLRMAIGINAFVAFVGQPVVPLIPVVALDMFDATSVQYGVLAGSFGVGAIVGAVATGRLDGHRRPSAILALGAGIYAVSVLVLGVAPSFVTAVLIFAGVGGGFLMLIATNNSCIQHLSSDAMRGRVIGIWLVSFGVCNPLGVLLQGVLADAVGVRAVLVADGLLLAAFFTWLQARDRLGVLDHHAPGVPDDDHEPLAVGPVDPEELQ
jgi:MFS family permease